MPDQSLFSQDNPQETPAQQTSVPVESLFADQLKTIVDETGRQKYETPEDALKALKHSQEYIPSLKGQVSQYEQEIARLKAELEQRSSVEDLVSRLTTQQEPKDPATPAPAGLDEKAVQKMLEEVLAKRDTESTVKQNLVKVEAALSEKFGDKAAEVLNKKAEALGLTKEQLKNMAATTPQVVLSLFEAAHAPTPTPTAGGHRSVPLSSPEMTLEQRLAEAEKKVKFSGINRTNVDLVAQLRREMETKFGYQG